MSGGTFILLMLRAEQGGTDPDGLPNCTGPALLGSKGMPGMLGFKEEIKTEKGQGEMKLLQCKVESLQKVKRKKVSFKLL